MKDIIENIIKELKELYSNNSDGHDLEHTLRVYELAKIISNDYLECKKDIVEFASLLHDVDDYKLFNTTNNANARAILEKQGFDLETINEICNTINVVSFSKNKNNRPETIEGQIVQDADRLDALGAIGVARTFAYGGCHNRKLDASIEHFYEKLLLLKDKMNTETGKKMAEQRHEFLEKFLEEYKNEIECKT